MAKVASETVVAPQHRFVAGRPIDENVFELDGSFVEFSILDREAAILLLEFQVAFPSLHTRFMFAIATAALRSGLLDQVD